MDGEGKGKRARAILSRASSIAANQEHPSIFGTNEAVLKVCSQASQWQVCLLVNANEEGRIISLSGIANGAGGRDWVQSGSPDALGQRVFCAVSRAKSSFQAQLVFSGGHLCSTV